MSSQLPKPFEKPWFIVNCVALCIGIYAMIFHHATVIFGISMISFAAHAIYSGHFSLRNTDYSRREDSGAFWMSVFAYTCIGLFFCLIRKL
ncbi:hypothetical protein S2091_2901 [Solimicrobium silvestre]|uniref:Uncharacterized protein n=1 Tax=Solimicrobium silvestre TaxID=2099400 RepID=A0A2S9GXY9_9BURK|nr:hypothetical protein S2091_2901 [Solimicrobium silvestre]